MVRPSISQSTATPLIRASEQLCDLYGNSSLGCMPSEIAGTIDVAFCSVAALRALVTAALPANSSRNSRSCKQRLGKGNTDLQA